MIDSGHRGHKGRLGGSNEFDHVRGLHLLAKFSILHMWPCRMCGWALTSATHDGSLPNVPLAAAKAPSISRAEVLTLFLIKAGVDGVDTMCSPPDQPNENCHSCAHWLRWLWAGVSLESGSTAQISLP